MSKHTCAYCGGVGATTHINHYNNAVGMLPTHQTHYHPECRALKLQGK